MQQRRNTINDSFPAHWECDFYSNKFPFFMETNWQFSHNVLLNYIYDFNFDCENELHVQILIFMIYFYQLWSGFFFINGCRSKQKIMNWVFFLVFFFYYYLFITFRKFIQKIKCYFSGSVSKRHQVMDFIFLQWTVDFNVELTVHSYSFIYSSRNNNKNLKTESQNLMRTN